MQHNFFNGTGALTFPDGGKYADGFKDNLCNGRGAITLSDGSLMASLKEERRLVMARAELDAKEAASLAADAPDILF